MNLNIYKSQQEQKQYDNQISRSNEGNLCPSFYTKFTSSYYFLDTSHPHFQTTSAAKQQIQQNQQSQQSQNNLQQKISSQQQQPQQQSPINKTTPQSLRILTFNIAEFVEKRQGLGQIEKVLDSNDIQNNVDIICLTEILAETWNQFTTERRIKKSKNNNTNIDENISEIYLNNVKYYCIINYSKNESQRSKGKSRLRTIENNNTAGTAILISQQFNQLPHTVLFDFSLTQEQQNSIGLDQESLLCLDNEGRLITLLFDDFCFVGMYAPNYSQKYSKEYNYWQDAIIVYINSLQESLNNNNNNSQQTIILSGDFNINPTHQTYNNLINNCNLEEVKGELTSTFYTQSTKKPIQIDYTFITQNNQLFNLYASNAVQEFELLVNLPKFHIPIYSVFQNLSENYDDEETKQLNQNIQHYSRDSNGNGNDTCSDDEDEDMIQFNQSRILTQSCQQSQIRDDPKDNQNKTDDIMNQFDEINNRLQQMNLQEDERNNFNQININNNNNLGKKLSPTKYKSTANNHIIKSVKGNVRKEFKPPTLLQNKDNINNNSGNNNSNNSINSNHENNSNNINTN